MSLKTFLKNNISGVLDNGRTGVLVKNVGLGFVAKGLSILISFIQIPLLLGILDKTEYGIWITIFSVTGWLSFFDIGMGNGFRNQLTEALALKDMLKAKKLVSTIYLSLAGIFSAIVLVFLLIAPFISWPSLFNAPLYLEKQLYYTVIISVGAAALNFVAALIHIILAAKHQTGKSGILFLISQFLILLFILWYRNHQSGNDFLVMSVVLSVMPLLVNIIINFFYFFSAHKEISPSFKHYNKSSLKSLMNLGFIFFLIQISAMVMFATDSFLINKLFGAKEVTVYSISYKYFSIMLVIFSIITAPLWTMYVDSFASRDFNWIKSNVKRLVQFVWLSLIILILMNLAAPFVFKIWIGKEFTSPLLLNISLSIYMLVFIWGSIWVLPLNAAGIIKIQAIVACIQAIVNIPLIVFLSKYYNNMSVVIIGNIICIISGSSYIYFYYKKQFQIILRSLKDD